MTPIREITATQTTGLSNKGTCTEGGGVTLILSVPFGVRIFCAVVLLLLEGAAACGVACCVADAAVGNSVEGIATFLVIINLGSFGHPVYLNTLHT
jgi:hypothetical protein